MNWKNAYFHWKKIRTHRKWVRHYCWKQGLYWQGLIHDLSKYSPTEFFESVKYYQGTDSPIVAAKKDKGYSLAWQHHKGRNPHHYEYWTDNYDTGGTALLMPYKYFVEQICDYVGAARAYMGKDFSYVKELEWWNARKGRKLAMNQHIVDMMDIIFNDLAANEILYEDGIRTHGPEDLMADKKYFKNVYEANKG